MAWRQIDDKQLSEQMLTQFPGAYMWHQGVIGNIRGI